MTIDQSYLAKRFTYERETGLLYWRPLEHDEYGWNRRFAGKVAGCVKATGYRHIALDGKWYQAHRLIWMLVYGEWPDKVDHVNGNKSDNRIENMRSVSDAINAKNMPLSCANTSGHIGVSWNKHQSRWVAYIKSSKRHVSLGAFKEKACAITARKIAELRFGFHENHGRAG